MQDIKKYVVDDGKSQVEPAKFGENLYNRGVYNSVLIAEAIRTAQEMTGKTVINAEDMRAGLEASTSPRTASRKSGWRASCGRCR